MCNFYDLYCNLCDEANLTPSGAATAIGFNRATVTTWKNTGNAPKGDLLLKISEYFGVPVDFLLQKPPFDCWDLINQNRKGFLHYIDIDPVELELMWGIDPKNPDKASMKSFILFISMAIETVRPTEEGDWDIKLRLPYQKEKAPTPESEQEIKNPDIRMIARAGQKMTPEQAENLRKYAQFMYPEAFDDNE